VQDELGRESRADVATVAASYGLMLAYVAAALGALPPPWAVWFAGRGARLAAAAEWLRAAALSSRAGLGLAGVGLVAASVAGGAGGERNWVCLVLVQGAAWVGTPHVVARLGLEGELWRVGWVGGVWAERGFHAPRAAASLGVFSGCGGGATLIILEALPFLVLAVGVDNMFVLAHALAKQVGPERSGREGRGWHWRADSTCACCGRRCGPAVC
jgi:hypothetical protein